MIRIKSLAFVVVLVVSVNLIDATLDSTKNVTSTPNHLGSNRTLVPRQDGEGEGEYEEGDSLEEEYYEDSTSTSTSKPVSSSSTSPSPLKKSGNFSVNATTTIKTTTAPPPPKVTTASSKYGEALNIFGSDEEVEQRNLTALPDILRNRFTSFIRNGGLSRLNRSTIYGFLKGTRTTVEILEDLDIVDETSAPILVGDEVLQVLENIFGG